MAELIFSGPDFASKYWFVMLPAYEMLLLHAKKHDQHPELQEKCYGTKEQPEDELTLNECYDGHQSRTTGPQHGGDHADNERKVCQWRISEAVLELVRSRDGIRKVVSAVWADDFSRCHFSVALRAIRHGFSDTAG